MHQIPSRPVTGSRSVKAFTWAVLSKRQTAGKPLPLVQPVYGSGRFHFASFRPAFQAEVAPVAALVQLLPDARVVDLAGAGLVAAGMIGNLVVGDSVEILADVAAQVAFCDLQVVHIGKHLHVR